MQILWMRFGGIEQERLRWERFLSATDAEGPRKVVGLARRNQTSAHGAGCARRVTAQNARRSAPWARLIAKQI
jgi:hypothetical protein